MDGASRSDVKSTERGRHLTELGDEALGKFTHLLPQILLRFLRHVWIDGMELVNLRLSIALQVLYLLLQQL